jgi:hypothetical protein
VNSFLNSRADSGTIYDLVLSAYMDQRDAKKTSALQREAGNLIEGVFQERRCFDIYVDGELLAGGDGACDNEAIDSSAKYPAYGKDILVRVVIK